MILGNAVSNVFKAGLLTGGYDFDSDTFKMALYTSASTLSAATPAYTTAGEVVASGYTAGGNVLIPTVTSSGGISFVSFVDTSWSGAITARGALIYKSGSGNPAVCMFDFGSDMTSSATFTVRFPPATTTSAIIRIS
jgi:hypothetical protein